MEMTDMLWNIIRTELEDVVGVENVNQEKADILTHGHDGCWLTTQYVAKGITPTLPWIVVRPSSTQEVSRVLQICNYYKVPVVPYGGGSGSQGGIMPVVSGVS